MDKAGGMLINLDNCGTLALWLSTYIRYRNPNYCENISTSEFKLLTDVIMLVFRIHNFNPKLLPSRFSVGAGAWSQDTAVHKNEFQ